MITGRPYLLICPHCKGEKDVISLISGNLIDAEYWSDGKVVNPYLPEVSYVQKCPKCGKYYTLNNQEFRYSDGEHTWNTGELILPELKEAFVQLLSEGFSSIIEEQKVRMMLFHAYNDYYQRSRAHFTPESWEEYKKNAPRLADITEVVDPFSGKTIFPLPLEIDEEDHKQFIEQGRWLIENYLEDNLMKAEFCREIGDMEKAKEYIGKVGSEKKVDVYMLSVIKERIADNNDIVFKTQR